MRITIFTCTEVSSSVKQQYFSMNILLLAFYHPRYMIPLKRWGDLLSQRGWCVTQMYPDAYYKEDILAEFRKDYDVTVYFGHGIPGAWCGYRFISTKDFEQVRSINFNRIVLSLSCYSLNTAYGKSLGEVLIDNFLAKCVIGYEDRVKYEENLEFLNRIFTLLLNGDNYNFNVLQSVVNDFRNNSVKILFSSCLNECNIIN